MRAGVRLCKEAGHLVMCFLLTACYPLDSPSRHEIFPVVELNCNMLCALREHGHLQCPALQLVYNMTCESRVCRERLLIVSKDETVRQNRELVMT
jgi:hypothetical protein